MGFGRWGGGWRGRGILFEGRGRVVGWVCRDWVGWRGMMVIG